MIRVYFVNKQTNNLPISKKYLTGENFVWEKWRIFGQVTNIFPRRISKILNLPQKTWIESKKKKIEKFKKISSVLLSYIYLITRKRGTLINAYWKFSPLISYPREFNIRY